MLVIEPMSEQNSRNFEPTVILSSYDREMGQVPLMITGSLTFERALSVCTKFGSNILSTMPGEVEEVSFTGTVIVPVIEELLVGVLYFFHISPTAFTTPCFSFILYLTDLEHYSLVSAHQKEIGEVLKHTADKILPKLTEKLVSPVRKTKIGKKIKKRLLRVEKPIDQLLNSKLTKDMKPSLEESIFDNILIFSVESSAIQHLYSMEELPNATLEVVQARLETILTKVKDEVDGEVILKLPAVGLYVYFYIFHTRDMRGIFALLAPLSAGQQIYRYAGEYRKICFLLARTFRRKKLSKKTIGHLQLQLVHLTRNDFVVRWKQSEEVLPDNFITATKHLDRIVYGLVTGKPVMLVGLSFEQALGVANSLKKLVPYRKLILRRWVYTLKSLRGSGLFFTTPDDLPKKAKYRSFLFYTQDRSVSAQDSNNFLTETIASLNGLGQEEWDDYLTEQMSCVYQVVEEITMHIATEGKQECRKQLALIKKSTSEDQFQLAIEVMKSYNSVLKDLLTNLLK